MCFSLLASFAASTVLATIGGATIQMTLMKKAKYYLMYAFIPLLFSIQQFIEGISWRCLLLNECSSCSMPSATSYLIFVGIVWPIWFPLANLLTENKPIRRRLLTIIFVCGIFLSVMNSYFILDHDIVPRIINQSIFYAKWYPQILIYGPIIILPFLISSQPGMWIVGVLFTAALVVTAYYFSMTATSVWCFFSAIMSVVLYAIIDRNTRILRS